jgi:hypothetical protein
VIAAAGLAFGSLTAASAAAGHGGPPSIAQQAAKVKAEDAFTPRNGNTEMNVTVLEDQIEHYYGSASATFPVVGTVTVPSPSSNYAKQMHQIVSSAESYLGWAIHQHHGPGKPAVVFDIDDTLLNTYDYEITGRPQTQTDATVANLVSAGYAKPDAGHLFLKPATPPSYLLGGNAGHQVKIPNPMYYIPDPMTVRPRWDGCIGRCEL